MVPTTCQGCNISSKEVVLPGSNNAEMGPANSIHPSAEYSEYNKRFNLFKQWLVGLIVEIKSICLFVCLECRLRFLDLIFLLDASGSITDSDFNLVQNWTKEVSNNFRISDGSTRIGVIRYSHYNPSR